MNSRYPALALVSLSALSVGLPGALATDVAGVDYSGVAGGPVHAVRYGVSSTGPCRGWITSAPNHTLVLATATSARIDVRAAVDTTLVVRGADEFWCSDDDDGFNPGLENDFPAGTYQIWVGTYDRGASATYTLSIVEPH